MREPGRNEYINHNGEVKRFPVGLFLLGWCLVVSFLLWLFFHV